MAENFDLKATGKMFNDCTASYDIIFKQETTVEDFVKQVCGNAKDWGDIYLSFVDEDIDIWNAPNLEYRYGKILATFKGFDDYKNRKIISATAQGGWTKMDYTLKIVKNKLDKRRKRGLNK